MSYLIIGSPGFMTTVQDCGRKGYQRYGMPEAGAMDIFSLQLANYLVGNKPCDACLEATITGPEIFFNASGAIAVTGADMDPCRNGIPFQLNRTIAVKNGDRVNFSGLKSGCRSYIAIAGGIDVPDVMGSRSTYLRAGIGGLEGRALRRGDRLPLGEISNKVIQRNIPRNLLPDYNTIRAMRIIPGPEIGRFTMEGIKNLLTTEYSVTDQSDRMGFRLSGEPILHKSGTADIISAGIAPGTVQVPGNGQPIILMADRPTTGGYTRIGHIATVDLTIVAQLKPGDRIFFTEITLEEAQRLLVERKKLIDPI